MDFRYVICRTLDLAMIQTNNLSEEDIRYCELGVVYIIDLVTLTEYTKDGKWLSIKSGKSEKK